MVNKIEVVIQHFDGCPNGPKLIDSVRKAIEGLENKVDFSEMIIDTEEKAKDNDFRGSPTLLIDGEDFEGMEKPTKAALPCRFYAKGLPLSDSIRKKILLKFR